MNLALLLAAEDPSQSKQPIFPEAAEMVYGTIATLIVLFLLWKFAVPAIKQMLRDRTERIQKQLDEATTARSEADAAAAEIRDAKGDIEAERTRILAGADDQARRLLDEGRVRLEDEVVELEAKAETDISAAWSRLVTELEAEVAEVAASAIERLVADSLDEAAHHDLVEDFIARVGASR